MAFKVRDGKGVVSDDASFVIWTTTPWTLPSNLGIFDIPDYVYAEVKLKKDTTFVVAKELNSLAETLG